MDWALRLHRFIPSLALSGAHRGKLLDPRFVTVEFDTACSRNCLAQKLAAIGYNSKVDTAPAANLFRFDINLDNTRIRGDDAVASTSRQSNTRAEENNEVSAFATAPGMGGRVNRAECAET